ncbi:TetR/AcrR family transcriptional regulator [Quadrisphaera sp. DSM 44207]|uniref:TetR/AcrR family transcriptional regulator n=1 Tax=Quadrisphaera sp. DSM 44207 TaxID=1881057 RepID=UPI0008896CA6|nr:TetR/AcrR family transcriptional regulator [Quadrisphaera sp. DSM 44207]SDQ39655.1 transcriptional regulator, TetR family [Quadrisphaera sp. DSM 44207]
MGRWDPNARERLESAALALFVEQGYEETTIAQIADRAGLTRSTFFRHFADKREVVFGGQDVLADLLAGAVRDAPASARTIECLAAALDTAALAFTPERHALARQRRSVVAATSELQERELLKLARLSSAVADALRARGAEEMSARLGAELGVLAVTTAFARWAAAEDAPPFAEIAHATLHDLRVRAAALGAPADVGA